MSEPHFLRARERREVIAAICLARLLVTIWTEIRTTLLRSDIRKSVRLRLEQQFGLRTLRWQGIEPVHRPYCKLPTLLIDAVLPDKKILRRFHPQVQVVAEVNARASPHTRTYQILDAPFTSMKLDSKGNLEAAYRYIIQEWLLIGRKDTLIICQQKVEHWLRKHCWLPDNIFVEHYFNISGVDRYKEVALGILLGRPAPGPRDIEAVAEALSGVQQEHCLRGPNGFVWYPPEQRGIRLASGGAILVKGDRHPAVLGEAVRYAHCEGELINAYGRLRAILRTSDTPCRIRLLFNTVLPITIDEVVQWSEPSRVVEEAVEGLVPTVPGDLMVIWPERYKTLRAAQWALKNGVLVPPGFVPISFQYAGTRGNRPGRLRLAYYDPKLITEPEKWLRGRFGRPLVFPGAA